MKKYYIINLIFFLFIYQNQFSQTIFSQDFSSESLGAISTSAAAYPFTTNGAEYTSENCDSDDDWKVVSAGSWMYGTAPSGMSGNRAAIRYGASDCVQHQRLRTNYWQLASSGNMKVSFSYSYNNYDANGYTTGDEFWAQLMKWNGSSWVLHNNMVNLESSDGSANVSSVFSVSSGEYFRLDFWYFGNNDLGASVDFILVEWATPEITVGPNYRIRL